MIVGLIAVFFLKEIPLKGGRLNKKEGVEDEDEVERSLAAMM